MAGVKGRSGGARPGSGRPRGRKSIETIHREAMMNQLARDVRELVEHAKQEKLARRNEYETAPAILKRLTEIERHLKLREEHKFPRSPSRTPFRSGEQRERIEPRAAAAEALFKPQE